MEGYQQGSRRGREGRTGEKVQGVRSIIGSYKIDRTMLRIVQEMEKPKNLYVRSMDMNQEVGGEYWRVERYREEVDKGEGKMGTVIA